MQSECLHAQRFALLQLLGQAHSPPRLKPLDAHLVRQLCHVRPGRLESCGSRLQLCAQFGVAGLEGLQSYHLVREGVCLDEEGLLARLQRVDRRTRRDELGLHAHEPLVLCPELPL